MQSIHLDSPELSGVIRCILRDIGRAVGAPLDDLPGKFDTGATAAILDLTTPRTLDTWASRPDRGGLPFVKVGRSRRNHATAITRAVDGVAWFDHSSGVGGFVGEDGTASTLDAAELDRIRIAARAQRRHHEAEERARRSDAIERARRTWATATPATAHPYLEAKGVAVAALRVDADGGLLVPRRAASGRVVGWQRIGPDGTKRYSAGTPTRGTFFGLGVVDPAGTVLVAEGLATGATVHAETGHPCAVAFDAGNLAAVALLLRSRYPAVRIVLCADDDRQTPGNPGGTKAIEAARAVDGCVALPPLCRCCRCTDFNDAAACARRRGAA